MIDNETHHLLVSWGQWARGSIKPIGVVQCGSAESKHLPRVGNTGMTATQLLESARSMPSEEPVIQVEILVMRMPDLHKNALRLEYVIHKRMPLSQKCKTLGVSKDDYFELVQIGANHIRSAML